MGRSISPMCETTVTGGSPRAAPRLIVPMSLRLAIPRRVALQQSSPPLHQPTVILKQKERLEKENPLNGKCASFRLSQLRGSPHQSVRFSLCSTQTKTAQTEVCATDPCPTIHSKVNNHLLYGVRNPTKNSGASR